MNPTNCMSKHTCVLVVMQEGDDGEPMQEIFGPFHNRFGAANYYDLVVKPDLVYGGPVTSWEIKPLEIPGEALGTSEEQWMRSFG